MNFPTEEEIYDFYTHQYRLNETGPEYPLGAHRRTQVIRAGRQFALIFLALKQHKRFLDIGCALGWSVHAASFMGLEAYGVEPGVMDQKFAMDTWGLVLHNKLEDLPVRDFDLILLSHMLEHVIDPIGYLSMLVNDYMAPEGRVIIEVPTFATGSAWSAFHAIMFTTNTLIYTIEQAGLRVEQMRSRDVDPSYPANLMWAVGRKEQK